MLFHEPFQNYIVLDVKAKGPFAQICLLAGTQLTMIFDK